MLIDKLKRNVKKPLAPKKKPVAPRAKIREQGKQKQSKARKS